MIPPFHPLVRRNKWEWGEGGGGLTELFIVDMLYRCVRVLECITIRVQQVETVDATDVTRDLMENVLMKFANQQLCFFSLFSYFENLEKAFIP